MRLTSAPRPSSRLGPLRRQPLRRTVAACARVGRGDDARRCLGLALRADLADSNLVRDVLRACAGDSEPGEAAAGIEARRAAERAGVDVGAVPVRRAAALLLAARNDSAAMLSELKAVRGAGAA